MNDESGEIINLCNTTELIIAGVALKVLVPDLEKIRSRYFSLKHAAFPFWARVWPAAKALSRYLIDNNEILSRKSVLEVGAGLGLPSLFASRYADKVICTDLFGEGLVVCRKNAEMNDIMNLTTQLFDWNMDNLPAADVIIASDISYDPTQFENLEKQIRSWIQSGREIVVSMPQRFQSVPFVQAIDTLIRDRSEFTIVEDDRDVHVSVFRL